MKKLLLSVSIGMLLGSTSMASSTSWHCKERLQQCLNSGKGAVACSNQYDSCNGPKKRCRKVAEKSVGHASLSPFHLMLWPFYSVFSPFISSPFSGSSSIDTIDALEDCANDRDSL